jgi:hypothetical protein
MSPDDRLCRIASKLRAAERYRFVPEIDFDIERILNCVRLAAKALVVSDPGLEASVKVHFERIALVDRSDQYGVLGQFSAFKSSLCSRSGQVETSEDYATATTRFRKLTRYFQTK